LTSRNYTRALVRWIPAILWAAVILIFSNDLFSAGHTAEWLGGFNFPVRKAAHLSEYFLLGVLLFRALRGDAPGFRARWAVMAVVLAACVAAADEWHQSFVPSRTASAWDVLLDSVGAAIAQIVWRYNSRA
jgi:hypothetical protein